MRCSWVNECNPLYIEYHDNEWGKPIYDDNKLFEVLSLEIFEAGLSFETILNKRKDIRIAFDNFSIDIVSKYKNDKITELMNDKKIIRHELKIKAIINNASVIKSIQKEYQNFANYIWGFKKINNENQTKIINIIYKDLKNRHMKFIGPKIIKSYLEAIGFINGHEKGCDMRNISL